MIMKFQPFHYCVHVCYVLVPISRLFLGVQDRGCREHSLTLYPCSMANLARSESTRFIHSLPGIHKNKK